MLSPLLTAPTPIPSHGLAALATIVIGAAQFVLPKGTRLHRWIGWTFVLLMGFVAVSGLFIYSLQWIGPFSPIHVLSLYMIWALYAGVAAARARKVPDHRQTMILIYALGVVVTGFFTLLPGRIMYAVVFG
jgi:uncharacterized membrane protein